MLENDSHLKLWRKADNNFNKFHLNMSLRMYSSQSTLEKGIDSHKNTKRWKGKKRPESFKRYVTLLFSTSATMNIEQWHTKVSFEIT